ncbi:D-aminoacylase [Colwellia sp. 1_MG-2023]|uniref:N-acyl-D-amino-acid deacylase family protein n=1 Tax=Colwellia sp. 1_MG-2023 TaxID=3062649 RepID=UPI0026E3D824|nr:D-aminoacylase [Colwellia sp. 1_MG-2023]MDO6445499.1 D-aminoacylase [Colwellia sp. 1_MG-2023]
MVLKTLKALNAERESSVFDTVISQALVIDGSGKQGITQDVAIKGNKIAAIGDLSNCTAKNVINGQGLVLAPGFIDVHTHDDLEVVRNPEMMAKISQGVATVVVGNCGISASPYSLKNVLPDPINLLGQSTEFQFADLASYATKLSEQKPNVNVVALVGHTALRAQVMDDLSQPASGKEISKMSALLKLALAQGAKGFSTGLAYKNAQAAPSDEVASLAKELANFDAIYTTHLRTEFDGIIGALDEAFSLGKKVNSPVVISHLKCAGKQNWGRAKEVIAHVKKAQQSHEIACDCYPYHASSSTLDLKQVTDDFEIFITWSDAEPSMAGKTLADIAKAWQLSLYDAAVKLMPAGAVYHGMNEKDVEDIVQFPSSMFGSDGLPCDPHPHPRLWGSFPRVLGHFTRDKKLLSIEQAVHKMTGLSATNFKLLKRGFIKTGYFADLVLFDAENIQDQASFSQPFERSIGVKFLWVNGQLTYQEEQGAITDETSRAGLFLKHEHSVTSDFNEQTLEK